MSDLKSNRKLAATLARKLYALEITFKQFAQDFPDETNDYDIDKLFDLIEHEPKKGRLFGVSKIKHEGYISEIFELISKLEK